MKNIAGTGVALVTPFKADLSIDSEAFRRLIRKVSDGGVDFLVPLGTTGESVCLKDAESETIIRLLIEENTKNLPVVLGCGGNDTYKVLEKQKAYEKIFRPDAFLSVTPYYNKPSQAGLYKHFRTLADHTDIPIVLYNVPGRTGVNLLPETVLNLAKDCPTIIAIKEASGNIEQGVEILRNKPEGFTVLSGDDTLALPQMAAGYSGIISVAANGRSAEFSAMVKACLQGDFATALPLYYTLFPWMQALFMEGNPVGIKTWLELAGEMSACVRPPLVEGSEKLRVTLKAYGL